MTLKGREGKGRDLGLAVQIVFLSGHMGRDFA
jgi:hypothetical protein